MEGGGNACNCSLQTFLCVRSCPGLQGAQHSAQIFSLAMLLSSIFIYNQVGAIDAIAIERLAMVCELAKRIKGRSTVGEVCSLLGCACRQDRDTSMLAADGKSKHALMSQHGVC
jgi:hypothetical protein